MEFDEEGYEIIAKRSKFALLYTVIPFIIMLIPLSIYMNKIGVKKFFNSIFVIWIIFEAALAIKTFFILITPKILVKLKGKYLSVYRIGKMKEIDVKDIINIKSYRINIYKLIKIVTADKNYYINFVDYKSNIESKIKDIKFESEKIQNENIKNY